LDLVHLTISSDEPGVSARERERGLRFAIFVVAYNAVTTLRKVLDRIPKEAWDAVEEVFVFDDASQDDTEMLGQGYKASRGIEKLRIYRNDSNLGYGGNQKKGYAYAIEKGYDYVILLHGDGQYAPELIPEFIKQARSRRPAAVFGSRMLLPGAARQGGMPLYKYMGNKILTFTENRLLGTDLSEFHSGYRMYATDALQRLHFNAYTDDFHFDTQVIVELVHHGFEIMEIPIPTYYGGEICYVNGMRYAKDVVLAVLGYRLYSAGVARCDWIDPEAARTRYPAKRSPLSSHRRVAQLVPAGSKVLDLGAEGSYLAELKAKGCSVTGVNLTAPPSEIVAAYDRFLVRDLDALGLPPAEELGRFDAILMADILEHLRSARALLSSAKALLTDQGVVIASTANIANWTVRMGLLMGRFTYRGRGILDETHVHLYTRRTFRALLRHEDYEVLRSKVTPIPFELLAGKGALIRGFWRTVEYGYYAFAKAWPTMFAYQFILIAKPLKGGKQSG
jgi:glycosyltransferase involved in cell wall biosynthesis/2-polyprenyl-3-methyl-5-hydroxy-6-metoxy-1,4-benzoquinol methylase